MLVILVAFAQTVETRCSVENEDVVGAAPTGDAPTISEWWTFLLPTKVHRVLDFWEYALKCIYRYFDEIINIDCTTSCQNDNFLLSQTKSLFPCTWCMYIRYFVLSYFIDVASTLYLEFAHTVSFVVIWIFWKMYSFTHIIRGYFTGIEQCQLSNPEGYR